MKTTSFESVLRQSGNNTGVEVPVENLNELGSGKKPAVRVKINGYEYESSIASMGGNYLISFSKIHREASKINGGDAIKVELEVIEGYREIPIPIFLEEKLKSIKLLSIFKELSYSKRKEHIRQINDAKTVETRTRRIEKVLDLVKLK